MTAALCSDARYGLYLGVPTMAAPAPRALVAWHLGLEPHRLDRHLRVPGSPLLRGLSRTEATRLRTLLQAVGWPASIRADTDVPVTDLSLQPAVWADMAPLVDRLSSLLGDRPSVIQAALLRPGGLVLRADDPRRTRLQNGAADHLRGLTLIASDPQTALHDIFPLRPLSPHARTAILRQLGPYGGPACGTTGALAQGLPGSIRDRVLARLDPSEVIAVDRAFQRFELHLIGVTGWVGAELADFLALRTGQPRARFEVISPPTSPSSSTPR